VTVSSYVEQYGVEPQVGDIVNMNLWSGTVTSVDESNVTITSNPTLGYIIDTLPWDMEVVEITDDSIKLEFLAEVDGIYQNAYGTIKVTEITDDEITFYQETLIDQIETIYGMADLIDIGDSFQLYINPEEGKMINSTDGYAVITNITDTTFDLDYNPLYVGEDIVYLVKVEKIIKAEN